MMTSPVAEYLRGHNAEILEDWERAVAEVTQDLERIERESRIDRLPELLNGLAAWLDGDEREADRAFTALADGHALQRLGFGIELATISLEYAQLRQVLVQHLLSHLLSDWPLHDIREQMLRMHQGLDRGVRFAVLRYSKQRDHMRDRFISILAHDLRSPLSAAMMSAEALVLSSGFSGEDRDAVESIAAALERMSSMTRDLLEFARAHSVGGVPTALGKCDLGRICAAAVREIRCAHLRVDIRMTTNGDLAGMFDEARVYQAMVNLLLNAIQHGSGPIDVAVWEADDRGSIFTRVTNGGRAIPPEALARLFDPYVNAGDVNAGHFGLGIFIVSQIARAHGATCDVASSDRETSFIVRWPRAPSA